MSKPGYLPPPPLRDHQFINFAFLDMLTVAGSALGHVRSAPAPGAITAKHGEVDAPSKISPIQAAAVSEMTDDTFSRLSPILHFVVENKLVDSKRGLAAVTAYLLPSIMAKTGEMPGQFTMSQAQVYVIHQAKPSLHIHWAGLANLYNDVTDDQQEAISNLFSHVFKAPLRDLYSVSAPALSLPASFKQDEWRHEDDGEIAYTHSEYLDTWLREDIADSQFWIEGRLPDGESTIFIASAPTLQEAIGYASAYVMNANAGGTQAKGLGLLASISIDFNRVVIAEASIVDSSRYRSVGNKLKWQVCAPEHELFSKALFMNELNEAESKLGLSWSKKNWLEQDLAP